MTIESQANPPKPTTAQRDVINVLDRLLSEEELRLRLGVSVRTMYRLKAAGELPPRLKIGNKTVYIARDVAEWFESRKIASNPTAAQNQ